MKNWQDTLISPHASILDTVKLLDQQGGQICLVIDDDRHLQGTVTDGDIRRGLLAGILITEPVSQVMNTSPVVIRPTDDRADVMAVLKRKLLRHVPLLDGAGRVVGLETPEELQRSLRRPNWVILMAGGEGQRLRPLTDAIPKPLIKIGDRPILETILLNFIACGFRKFFISVNYRAEQVVAHFGDGARWDVEIHYLYEECKMGTAGPLSLLPAPPTDDVFVMNGDILTDVNFDYMLEFHRQNGAQATMCVREHAFTIPYGVVDVDGPMLVRIDEKPTIKNYVNGGIYLLSPQAVAMVPPDCAFTMPELFEKLLQDGKTCSAFPLREYWIDVGRHEDLDRAKTEFAHVFG